MPADLATELFGMLLPDLSHHMSRRPDQIMEMCRRWLEYKQHAQHLLPLLSAEGPSRKARALARKLFGRHATTHDLSRWLRDAADADEVARDLMTRAQGISRKTLRDYRRLWGQAEAVEEAWQHFDEYFLKLSPEEQRRLVPLVNAPDSRSSSAPQADPTD